MFFLASKTYKALQDSIEFVSWREFYISFYMFEKQIWR